MRANKTYVGIDNKLTLRLFYKVLLLLYLSTLYHWTPSCKGLDINSHSGFNIIHVHCQVITNPTFPSSLRLKKFI